MQLRAVQEFIVHIESFRNIDIWYQGGYLLCLQIYTEVTTADKRKEVPRSLARKYMHIPLLSPNTTWLEIHKQSDTIVNLSNLPPLTTLPHRFFPKPTSSNTMKKKYKSTTSATSEWKQTFPPINLISTCKSTFCSSTNR